MGDMADDAMEMAMRQDALMESVYAEVSRHKENYKLGILRWGSANGSSTLIQNMTDAHVLNVKKHLSNKKGGDEEDKIRRDALIEIFNYEILKREL